MVERHCIGGPLSYARGSWSQLGVLREKFGQHQFVALAAHEAVLDFIHERLNNKNAQTAPFARRDPIVYFVNGIGLVGGEVDARIILNCDFQTVVETRQNHHDFEFERLRRVGVLDDIGAGFADRHLDFGDVFVAKPARLRGLNDRVPNLGQRGGRAVRAHLLVPRRILERARRMAIGRRRRGGHGRKKGERHAL